MVLESHKLPIVSYVLWIKSGALTDPRTNPAWRHSPLTCCVTALPNAPATQIASQLDDLGANFNSGAPLARRYQRSGFRPEHLR